MSVGPFHGLGNRIMIPFYPTSDGTSLVRCNTWLLHWEQMAWLCIPSVFAVIFQGGNTVDHEP